MAAHEFTANNGTHFTMHILQAARATSPLYVLSKTPAGQTSPKAVFVATQDDVKAMMREEDRQAMLMAEDRKDNKIARPHQPLSWPQPPSTSWRAHENDARSKTEAEQKGKTAALTKKSNPVSLSSASAGINSSMLALLSAAAAPSARAPQHLYAKKRKRGGDDSDDTYTDMDDSASDSDFVDSEIRGRKSEPEPEPDKKLSHNSTATSEAIASSVPKNGASSLYQDGVDGDAKADDDIPGYAKKPRPPLVYSDIEVQERSWEEHFRHMRAYVDEFGDCLVPLNSKSHPILAQWVKRQRHQYSRRARGDRSTMTDYRVEKLESIGFVWQAQVASWYERFRELKEFHTIHKHCKVPTRYAPNKALGAWVKCQRTQYRKWQRGEHSNMSHERIEHLNKLGFTWEGR